MWGNAFIKDGLPPDELVAHCGVEALELLGPMKNRLTKLELVVVAPGDRSGLTSSEVVVDSAAFCRGADLLALPPNWRTHPASREQSLTRSEGERLIQQAYEDAFSLFHRYRPAFDLPSPSLVSDYTFPDTLPGRSRELFIRAHHTRSIAKALTQGWPINAEGAREVADLSRNLDRAARRAFEAALA